MLFIALAMLAALVLAGLITVYAAFPHRGEDIPRAAWLSDAMTKSNRTITEKLRRLDSRVDEKIRD